MSASVEGTAVVVGGTSGLGKELARLLANTDLPLVIAGRSAEDKQPVNREKERVPSLRLTLDLRSSNSIDTAAAQLASFDQTFNIRRIFMVAGRGLKGAFLDQTDEQLDELLAVNVAGQARFLHRLMRTMRSNGARQPIQLIIISSTTAWKARADETWYGTTKAGLDQFARGFSRELGKDFPGSQVVLVHPGGMKGTEFYGDLPEVDTSSFMDPVEVARIIFHCALTQPDVASAERSLFEMQIERDEDGHPVVSYGPRLPQ